MKKMLEISDPESLNRLMKKGEEGFQLLIFKYSPLCSISYFVERSFDKWFAKLAEDTPVIALKVNVINSRELSRKIAAEFDIMHESPQAIWLSENREVKWHASHNSINDKNLTKQLIAG